MSGPCSAEGQVAMLPARAKAFQDAFAYEGNDVYVDVFCNVGLTYDCYNIHLPHMSGLVL